MKHITRNELMEILKSKFPKMWLRTSEEFSNEFIDCIWTGEGSYIDGINAFNYYAFNYYSYTNASKYTSGVHNKLFKVLNKYGWYADSYDPGTYMVSRK